MHDGCTRVFRLYSKCLVESDLLRAFFVPAQTVLQERVCDVAWPAAGLLSAAHTLPEPTNILQAQKINIVVEMM